jgi:hypothetical protein
MRTEEPILPIARCPGDDIDVLAHELPSSKPAAEIGVCRQFEASLSVSLTTCVPLPDPGPPRTKTTLYCVCSVGCATVCVGAKD